jgi:hypothetical protein
VRERGSPSSRRRRPLQVGGGGGAGPQVPERPPPACPRVAIGLAVGGDRGWPWSSGEGLWVMSTSLAGAA